MTVKRPATTYRTQVDRGPGNRVEGVWVWVERPPKCQWRLERHTDAWIIERYVETEFRSFAPDAAWEVSGTCPVDELVDAIAPLCGRRFATRLVAGYEDERSELERQRAEQERAEVKREVDAIRARYKDNAT